MKVRKQIHTLLFLFLLSGVHAQSPGTCLDMIRAAYTRMNTVPEKTVSANTAWYLYYSVRTVMRDSQKMPHHFAQIKVLMNDRQGRIITDHAKVFHDSVVSITQMPLEKVLYITDSRFNVETEKRSGHLTMLQDTLLTMCEVQSCRKIKNKQMKADREITLELNETGQRLFNITTITYAIATKTADLVSIKMTYLPTNEVVSSTIVFRENSYDYTTDLLDQPVWSLFFTPQEQLLAAYKDYRLVDLRAKNYKR